MSYKKLLTRTTLFAIAFSFAFAFQVLAEKPDVPEGKEKDYDYLIGATQIGTVDPYFDYLLGCLYVEMDSLDAALRHYSALRPQDIDYSSDLRFMMLRNPNGPAALCPNFEYPAALQKIMPSLVSVYTSWITRGWGCILNSEGQFYTYLDNYSNSSYARMGVLLMEPVDEERRKWDMHLWGYLVIESKSRIINNGYVIVETKAKDNLVEPEIRVEDLQPGEPVVIIQNPFMRKNIICTGQTVGVRDDPMLRKSIEIEPSEALLDDMILVADTLGRLVGFASTAADAANKNIYAFPVHRSCRFLGNTEYAVKGLSELQEEREKYEKNNAKLISDFELGKNLVWQGKYDEAVTAFNSIIAGHPDEARSYLYRGFSQWQLGNTDAAIADFTAASENDDELGEAQYQLALLYESLDDMDKAEDALKDACGMSKHNPLPHFELAKYYKEQGKKRKFKMEYATLKGLDKELADEIKD